MNKYSKVPDKEWPKIQVFAVYDGHGGHQCAEFLRD
jgi:serine/threonine protein phosphatase PrpC